MIPTNLIQAPHPSHPRRREARSMVRSMAQSVPWLLAVLVAGAPACKQDRAGQVEGVAVLRDADGTQVAEATFTSVDGGVKLHIEGGPLPPGPHGFHVHEHGVCEAPSFESAGDHFNPTDKRHGLEDPEGPHVGDLPNLVVDADGRVDAEFTLAGATLDDNADTSLLAGDGTALVIHAEPDDQNTDPAGDSGPRIACGVIENSTARR
jgi:superoxide dismutase, Cu-Zn family